MFVNKYDNKNYNKRKKENSNNYEIIEFKSSNTKIQNIKNETNDAPSVNNNKFNWKIIIFEFISIIIIIFVFFYLVSFGGIFVNNQKYINIRVISSLLTGLIIPFIFCLLYSFLRYLGLKKKIKTLYTISKIAQNY